MSGLDESCTWLQSIANFPDFPQCVTSLNSASASVFADCSRGLLQTRQDKTRQDKTRQETRQDKTRQDKTRQDKTRQDKTRQDKTRQDKTRQDKIQ